jgi:hypothetical protein
MSERTFQQIFESKINEVKKNERKQTVNEDSNHLG